MLVGVELKRRHSGFSTDDSLKELAQLASTAGLDVVGQTSQRVDRVNPATFVGKGKLEEIVGLRQDLAYDVVVFDEELQ